MYSVSPLAFPPPWIPVPLQKGFLKIFLNVFFYLATLILFLHSLTHELFAGCCYDPHQARPVRAAAARSQPALLHPCVPVNKPRSWLGCVPQGPTQQPSELLCTPCFLWFVLPGNRNRQEALEDLMDGKHSGPHINNQFLLPLPPVPLTFESSMNI